jgi:NAD(P)-dependent dehydrogenase (short-subunit alcohol dehydrogenase family)
MSSRLEGKVALITGAASGMGRATAELFAQEGATVAVTDFNPDLGRETVDAITAAGGRARFWQMDVSKEASVKTVTAEVVAEFGKLDVLVNCAGIIGVDKPTHEIT